MIKIRKECVCRANSLREAQGLLMQAKYQGFLVNRNLTNTDRTVFKLSNNRSKKLS